MLPGSQRPAAEKKIEDATLLACARFYRLAEVLFAPNVDLCRLLEKSTGRHCALMPRGVDTIAFSPEYRDRSGTEEPFVLGFCGRLSIEKNVFLLARIRTELIARGITNFRFLIVGHGKEESWLRQHLPNAEFTGRASRPGARPRLRQHGSVCVSFPYRYVWQCGSGGSGFGCSCDCHA